jgi:predicted dehydrogenase
MKVAIIGSKLTGRARFNVWRSVTHFLGDPIKRALMVACGRTEAALNAFADRERWEDAPTDAEQTVEKSDIDR